MDAAIKVDGGANPGNFAALAEAFALIMTTAGAQRTPEAVQLAIVEAMAGACSVNDTTISNCTFTGDRNIT